MTIPTAIEVNCATGEVTERPLTAEEIADNERVAAEIDAREAAYTALMQAREVLKTSAKAKLVAGTPLTEEEASVLVI